MPARSARIEGGVWGLLVGDALGVPYEFHRPEALRRLYPEASPHRQELEHAIRPDDLSPGRGTGYVVDCLRSARWAVDQGSYEQVVKSAVALGHDADTTACVAGGIAGLRDGVEAIPARFLEALGGKEIATPLIERLVAHDQASRRPPLS